MDNAILAFDKMLRAVTGAPLPSKRNSPARSTSQLTTEEKRQSARLMRINHTGEVCAQALYQGQALTAKSSHVAAQMDRAAEEEIDHLNWCSERIEELDGRVSHLNPLWYAGSFAMGAAAGLAGDRINLGFVAATENLVKQHLDNHLEHLPSADDRTREVLEQMRIDEEKHEQQAINAGAARFPAVATGAMKLVSRLMTQSNL